MRKKLETDTLPLKNPNRRKNKRADKAKYWCGSCDRYLVTEGKKCPVCGYRGETRGKIKYD